MSGRKLPVGRRALIDPDAILELVDQLRVAVPKDIVEAEEVLGKREELLNRSLQEARRIRASAETEYRSRVDESELVKEAKKQAAQVIEEAQQRVQRILDAADEDAASRRASADQYSQDVLYHLEQQVTDLLATLRRGIEVLETRQSAPAR